MTDYRNNFSLTGKVALVTGAARGLGAEMAEALLQAGATVVLTDVLAEVGRATAERLADAHEGRASFHMLDVTNEAHWEAVIDATVSAVGRLDIVVNNAGIEHTAFLTEHTLADFQRTMAINVEGVFLGVKHAARVMRPGGSAGQGGSIINISSAAGLIGMTGLSSYCASKGAVRLLTKAAGVEFGRLGYGVRVNSVHPAVIKTDLAASSFQRFVELGLAPSIEAVDTLLESLHPLGYGQPRDVASAVVFLAGDGARWMTGSELVVDGGLSAT